MKSLNCLMDVIPYQMLKVTFSTSSKSMNNKPPVKICVNKIQHRITLNIKSGYYLELLITECMKILGSTKEKITEDRKGGKAQTPMTNEKWEMRNDEYFKGTPLSYVTELFNLFKSSFLYISLSGH